MAPLREVQSLVGKLNFVACCVKPGRIFISRILIFLREFKGGKSSLRIPDELEKRFKLVVTILTGL